MFGRWEVDQNGTTAQVIIRFNVNGDKAVADPAAPMEELGRGRRERKAVMRYSPTNLIEYWNELDDLMEDISKHAALAAGAEAGQVV